MARLSTFRASLLALAFALAMVGGAALAQDGSAIDVELGEWYVDMPGTIPAGPVTLTVTNAGAMGHTLAIEGEGVTLSLGQNLPAGESVTMEIELEPGTYTFYCPVPGHPDAGMTMQVTAGDDPPVADAPAPPSSAGDAYDSYDYADPYAETSTEPTPVPATPTAAPEPTRPPATPTTSSVAQAPPPATPTAVAEETPTPVELTAGDSDTSSGGNMLLIALLAAAAVVVAGGGFLYRSQRRAV